MTEAKFAITGNQIVTPEAIISGHLVVEGDKILSLSPGPPPGGLETIDAGENLVAPGFIDLHIHGTGGWDTSTRQSTLNMAKILADNGVTAFYPTPATTEMELFLSHLRGVKEAFSAQGSGAKDTGADILGMHLEGPFLNRARKGAMPEEYLLDPDWEILDRIEAQAPGLIKRLTVAPELPRGLEFVAELRRRGYLVAGGHTAATAEETLAGIEAGITIANHLYNAMTGLHHRDPGAVGAFLTSDQVVCEIIADGIHVHPLAIEVALRCKGPANLYLISDAIMASGLPAGQYEFLNRRVTIDERGVSRQEDGTIAGSTCLLPIGFETIAKTLGHGPLLASRLASANPARVAGVSEQKGTLEAGKDADIIILDENYRVTHCSVRGVWQKTPTKSAQHLIRTSL
jgi:N-acetylglucosamine-6-phosphate deacetylase